MRFFGNVRYFCEMNRGPPVLRSTRGWFPTKRLMYTWRVLSSVAGTSLPAEVWLFGKPAFPIVPPNFCVSTERPPRHPKKASAEPPVDCVPEFGGVQPLRGAF